MATTEIVSHRGGTFLWPENSLQAFRNSLALPVEMVECDIHLSSDGVPVVIHDATLDRTTDGRGPVADRGAAELAATRIRGGGGEGVPRLAELAALVAPSRHRLQLEVKGAAEARTIPGAFDAALAVLDAAGLRPRTGLIAFEAETVRAALAAGGFDHVAWLFTTRLLGEIGAEGIVAVSRALGVSMIETDARAMDADLLANLRAAGLRVGVWGANHAPEMRRMLGLGVDVMATDDPPTALRLRDEGARA